jgi:MerR family transcriptional regulator, mercuric resistance operon regulatory protein
MNSDPRDLSIGGLAAAAEVNVETIRFYQRKGLLPRPRRAYGSVRRYGAPDVACVKFIKSAQRLGFSLGEIAGLLTLEDGRRCADARVLAEQKLEDVRAKLADLRRMESVLARLVERCGPSPGTIACPLIQAMHAARRSTSSPSWRAWPRNRRESP